MSIFTLIIIICWAAFILFWIVSSFGIKRDITYGIWRRLWWLRVVVAAFILSWLWQTSRLNNALFPPGYHPSLFPNTFGNTFLAGVGAILCLLGIALAIWARVHIGRNWSPAPALKEGHELVTSGPYRTLRHPIYTGIILAAFGSVLVSVAWIIMFIIVCGTFIWRVKVEEGMMTKQFPNQYPEYKKRTWALIPYIW